MRTPVTNHHSPLVVLCRKLILGIGFGLPWLCLGMVLLGLGPVVAGESLDASAAGLDATYRTTVVVRKGSALGTGVIVGSVEGETLILTAAHVIEEPGPLSIQIFPYNLGWEKTRTVREFPRRLRASIAARDPDIDLAVLRVSGQLAFPYVARIARGDRPLTPGMAVTSIGFDWGERLIGFPTRLRQMDRIDMNRGGGPRSFLITENPPEIGRSGGGLFLEDGTLIGICLARAQLPPAPVRGMYSTIGNIRGFLVADERLARVIARSHPVVPAPLTSTKVRRQETPRIQRTGDSLRAN